MKIHRDFILDRLRLIRVLKFFFILYSYVTTQHPYRKLLVNKA